MARVLFPFFFGLVLCMMASCIAESRRVRQQKIVHGSWCIAKPSADETKLQDNIDYSCKQAGVECSSISRGGVCFMPYNVVSRASVAMNLYYKSSGMHKWECYFNGTALIVQDDPSFGNCKYK